MKFIFTTLLFFFSLSAAAQCPFGNNSRLECKYGCDNFTDKDGDGYCDYSRTLAKETTDTATPKETPTPTKQTKENTKIPNQTIEETLSIDTVSKEEIIRTEEIFPTTTPPFKKPYRLILISILTLGSYFFTFLLSCIGILHKIYHRRIWNTLLLLTAAISCLFGFFLTIQLNYGFLGEWYRPILTWHVECGIAMTVIAVFHVIWHIPYYKRLFTKIKR